MTNDPKKEVIKLINGATTIGLITHKDGDGDAFGSMIGLSRGLQSLGKKTIFFSNEKLSRVFEFLNGSLGYKPKENYEKIDLLIGLDASSVARYTIPEIITTAKENGAKVAIIDHHVLSDAVNIADIYFQATEESCTSEMIFDVLIALGAEIDKYTANVLLLGIETDTFSMQFVNTKPRTFEVVAELLKKGARLKPIVESAFGGRPISTIKILGRTMNRLELDPKTGLAVSYITRNDAKELGLEVEASSGIANFLEQVDGAKIIAVFEERLNGMIKVSLRSNNSNTNVEKIAKTFNGGGHKKAAGYEYHGNLKDAIKRLKEQIV